MRREEKREGMYDDGVFNACQFSDQEFDDETVSIDSQTSSFVTLLLERCASGKCFLVLS